MVSALLLGLVPAGCGGSVTGTATNPQTPGRPAPTAQAFGVNVNRLFNDRTATPAEIASQLLAVQRTGATLARSDALWEWSEPSPPVGGVHHYDWSFDDAIAGALAAHGLTWLPIIDYTALWAESVAGQDHSPPSSVADYAAYAAALVARYGPAGTFWRAHPGLTAEPATTYEIWNEPDNGQFWAPVPNAGAYAQLYLAARGAIDAVNPGVRVLVGGLTGPALFLPAMLQAQPGLAGHVDGVAVHPYGPPAVVVTKVRAARATLDALGMSTVPIYVTEFGWTTDPPGAVDYAPAARRPDDILTALTALGHLDCGLGASILYTWVTPARDPANGQDWYGIGSPAAPGAATPDTAAFAGGLRAAQQPASPASPAPAPCPG